MSLSAFVAAIWPKRYGSLTIGVKKSAVCTIASSSVSFTTAASSEVLASTSTRGSVVAGRPATIGPSAAAGSLQPQPAPWDSSVSLIVMKPMIPRALADERYTAEQVDAAVAALTSDPERLGHAQELVTHAAPGLQRILNAALDEGGWFGSAHEEAVAKAAGSDDPEERLRLVRTLVA